MRNGMVLIELIAAMVLAAIIGAIAVPRLSRIADAAAVRDEALRVVAGLDATRGAAVRLNSVASLELLPARYRAVIVSGTDTILAWSQPGPAGNGVAITGTGAPVQFGPDGLAMGVANRTIVVSKGSALRRVVVSKLGRITY